MSIDEHLIETFGPLQAGTPRYPDSSVLVEAQKLVHGDRNADYGHPIDDFTKTAAMWSVIIGAPVTPEQVGLCMCAVKISRQLNNPKRDNLTDLAGYAETVNMIAIERERRAGVVKD